MRRIFGGASSSWMVIMGTCQNVSLSLNCLCTGTFVAQVTQKNRVHCLCMPLSQPDAIIHISRSFMTNERNYVPMRRIILVLKPYIFIVVASVASKTRVRKSGYVLILCHCRATEKIMKLSCFNQYFASSLLTVNGWVRIQNSSCDHDVRNELFIGKPTIKSVFGSGLGTEYAGITVLITHQFKLIRSQISSNCKFDLHQFLSLPKKNAYGTHTPNITVLARELLDTAISDFQKREKMVKAHFQCL